MSELRKDISRISWLMGACIEQYRFASYDIKKMQKVSYIYQSPIFIKFVNHFQLSLTLLKTGERNWTMFLKKGILNSQDAINIFNLYIKRQIYQFKLAYNALIKMSYEQLIIQNAYYFPLKDKVIALKSTILQLENEMIKLINFSF